MDTVLGFLQKETQLMTMLTYRSLLSLWVLLLIAQSIHAQQNPAVLNSEFIYQNAPFESCHASTIVERPGGSMMAAWFGGTDEGNDDVGIWVSTSGAQGAWSAPVEVANGIQHADLRYPCWNPVLVGNHSLPHNKAQEYKCGPNPREWWGMLIRNSRRVIVDGDRVVHVIVDPQGYDEWRIEATIDADESRLRGEAVLRFGSVIRFG